METTDIKPRVHREGANYVYQFDFRTSESEGSEGNVICTEVRVPVFTWDYAHLVSAIVRSRYRQDTVEAIMLNGDQSELSALEEWRTHAKNLASAQFRLGQTLDGAKALKLREISAYDKSNAVNSFFYQGVTMWLTFDKRKDMRMSVDAAIKDGRDIVTYWDGPVKYEFPTAVFDIILTKLELYAIDCYNVTEQHKARVSELTDIEAVLAYDYTVGYPDKLSF